jgi:hypothetical protein
VTVVPLLRGDCRGVGWGERAAVSSGARAGGSGIRLPVKSPGSERADCR